MINQKKKGSRIELEVANFLKSEGCVSARRSQQYAGYAGTADVLCTEELPSWHIEVKGTKSATITRGVFIKWLEQVKRDCLPGQNAVIINKANNANMIAVMTFDTWNKLLSSVVNIPVTDVIVLEDTFNPSALLDVKEKEAYIQKVLHDGLHAQKSERIYALRYLLAATILGTDHELLTIVKASDWVRMARV